VTDVWRGGMRQSRHMAKERAGGHTCGRKGSVSEGKKKKEKTNKLTAASRAPRRKAQRAWIQEKRGPPSERGSQYTCDGKGAVSRGTKRKKRKTNQAGGKGGAARADLNQKGPHSLLQARGSPCGPVRESGKRRKKKRTNQVAGAPRTRIRESGDPLSRL